MSDNNSAYLPMIGGVPFRTVGDRERLAAAAMTAPEPDPTPAAYPRPYLPNGDRGRGWRDRLRLVVRDGGYVQYDPAAEPEVSELVAAAEAEWHDDMAAAARARLAAVRRGSSRPGTPETRDVT